MTHVHWGIVGPGSIAHNFADGLAESDSGGLKAVCGRDPDRLNKFSAKYALAPECSFSDWQALLNADDIQAIYVATPHPFHAELSIAALRAGKHVLSEKPAGLTEAEVIAVTEVAAQERRFFMEGFMYRCHPQIARLREILSSGDLGDILHMRACFGFDAPFDPDSRAYNYDLAGGAILDVGCYPVSLARLVAGCVIDQPLDEPVEVCGVGRLAKTGVDASAYALLKFNSGFIAECATAVNENMDNTALITGSKGSVLMHDPWTPGRNAGPSDAELTITIGNEQHAETIHNRQHLFSFEAELASQCILAGMLEAEGPAPSWADSIGNAAVLDRWREAVGYKLATEQPDKNRAIPGVLPSGTIPTLSIPGVEKPLSQLIMGCDNQASMANGALVWDAWMEAGGNTFDTAFVYGRGAHEAALGEWIRARGVAADINVIAKGAHSPYCLPDAIEPELTLSLERLGLAQVPIYIMHRDNPEVPVGEFIDALNHLQEAGRIGVFGGSNWSVERLIQANAYAEANGKNGFSALNNNLSLAVMERPVWPGCISANNPSTLDWLEAEQLAHFAWSSQARGYFLPEELRHRLPHDTAPDTCFGSAANEQRRKRAQFLATERGVSAHNVATAWVLAQPFPSFALTGPRSAGEIASSLPALTLELTPREVQWLNLNAATPN
ncbi:MAG: aldo/keto reductase [Gammaproteobacteria bacterium]|nr:aldo/keto reductase [Gammaproteobacteria bacterium]